MKDRLKASRIRPSLAFWAMVASTCAFGIPRLSAASGPDASDAPPTAVVSPQASVPTNPPLASAFAGAEACATCHADEVKNFGNNPHARLTLMHNGKGVTCESCHGPGQAHIDSGGDVKTIFQFTKASPKQIDAKCLSCHVGAHPNFQRSPHGEANVSCTNCHSVHKFKSDDGMLKVSQPQLCFGCHTDVKPAFAEPFHHKVNEGLIQCTDCHDPHGSFQGKLLKTTADQNQICTKCHTETRGPFVFEHAAVKAEGCMGCHTPHGSQNARLLNMPNINTLCNQCHSPVSAATVHGMSAGSSELTPCISCHTMIHGSNINAAFIR